MTDRYAEICRSHWQKYESDDEHADRVERCTNEAHGLFTIATRDQKAAYDLTITAIAPYKNSPRWARMRAEATKQWNETTAPARELFLTTFEELMRDGEVSDATSDAWDRLETPVVLSDRRAVPVQETSAHD